MFDMFAILAELPPPPKWPDMFTVWRLDPLMLAPLIVMAALYVQRVRVLQSKGRKWPVGRTVSWMSGIALTFIATQSILERYDTVLFSLHAVQHVLLGMIAPALFVLGAPITLFLQTSSLPAKSRLLRFLRLKPVKLITHPLVAWIIFSAGMYAIYFTPLYELSLRSTWIHYFVHMHFLIAGVLFFLPAISPDPISWTLPYPMRLLYVFTTFPLHAFLGVAIISATTSLAGSWYVSQGRTWGASVLADQGSAGAIMWTAGDLLALLVLFAVVSQWWRHEERAAQRIDRLSGVAALDVSDASAPGGFPSLRGARSGATKQPSP